MDSFQLPDPAFCQSPDDVLRASMENVSQHFRLPRIDTLLLLGLFVLGTCIGTWSFQTFVASGGQPQFYQRDYGPAVMVACGRGFVNPDHAQLPALAAFLSTATDSFSCTSLPSNIPLKPLNVVQGISRYLLYTVSLFWRIFDISWSGLALLFGLLFGLVLVLEYGLFRLGMGRSLAVIGALLLMFSSTQLHNLPHLRDFVKAPFLLALLWIMGSCVTAPFNHRQLLGLSVLAGLVLGLGFGFRADLLITLLPFVLILFVFLPGSLRTNIPTKLTAFGLFFLCFLLASGPILAVYQSGGPLWHNALLGFTTPFNTSLGISGSFYEWGTLYNDMYIHTLVSSYQGHIHGERNFLAPSSGPYAQASAQYFFEIATHFPADLVTRTYASILHILDLSFRSPSLSLPAGQTSFPIVDLYQVRSHLLHTLDGIGVFCALGAFLLIGTQHIRKALAFLFVVVYFSGYPVIQFHERHFFHLEFLSLWTLGFLLQTAASVFPFLVQGQLKKIHFQRLLGLTAGLVLLVLPPLLLLRMYQHAQLGLLFNSYINADREPLALEQTKSSNGLRLLHYQKVLHSSEQRVSETRSIMTDYLVAEFSSHQQCDYFTAKVTFRYTAEQKRHDFSQAVEVPLTENKNRPTLIFFPVYYRSGIDFDLSGRTIDPPVNSYFTGIELSPLQLACLRGLYKVTDLSQFPLLLPLTFPPEWEALPRYQTLTHWESRSAKDEDKDHARLYTVPQDLVVTRRMVQSEPVLFETQTTFQADIIHDRTSSSFRVKGQAESPFSYLLTQTLHSMPGTSLVVQGELDTGGLTIGLLSQQQWAGQVNIVEKGLFHVVLQIPEAGADTLVFANCFYDASLYNHFRITRIGWVE